MLRRSSFASALIAVLGVSALAAQAGNVDTSRRPTFARVENGKGEPLANAEVTFAGCVPHLGVDAGPRDVQVVASDNRGRAQCKLLPGLCYVAWAVGPEAADGRRAVSTVRGWFGAGSLLSLRCADVETKRRVRVTGAEEWLAKGPLRFVAWTSAPGVDVEMPLAAGILELPHGPFQQIEVQTADRVPLFHWNVGGGVLAIPHPRALRVRAKDENGAPLAGASVRLRVGRLQPWRQDSLGSVVEERWRTLGVTGADGACDVEVPYAADPLQDQGHGDLMLFVGAPGRPSVAGGVLQNEFYADDHKVPKGKSSEWTFTCRRVEPLAGSLGRVPAGTVVHLAAVCKMFTDGPSYRQEARTFQAAVAADGRFGFDDVPAELHSCRFTLVPPPGAGALWPVFPSMRGRELPPEVKAGGQALLAEGYGDLTLQLLDSGGGPARGLVALLTPAAVNGVLVRDSTLRLPLDARGSASVRLVPGPWVVTAWSETGWVARQLDVKAGVAQESLAMQAHLRMRLELRDGRGQPIAGARVSTRSTTTRGTGDALQSILQSLRSQWVGGWNELRTDAAGRVEIPFIPVDGVTQKMGLQWNGGSTDDFVLAPGDDWVVVQAR